MHVAALRRTAWSHPELSAAAAAAGAWMLLLAPLVGGSEIRAAHAAAHESAPLLAGAAGWVLMVVAMMVPTALPGARQLALAAVWRRRRRTVALFMGGYVAVWAAFGAVALPLAALANHLAGPRSGVVLAAVLAVAAAWQLTPAKWRHSQSCRLVSPVAPDGPQADAGCVREGVRYGRRCAASCWPVMLAMAVAGHEAYWLMVLLAGLLLVERTSLRLAAPGAAVLAGAALVAIAA